MLSENDSNMSSHELISLFDKTFMSKEKFSQKFQKKALSNDSGSQGTCFDMIDVEEKCNVFGKLTRKI